MTLSKKNKYYCENYPDMKGLPTFSRNFPMIIIIIMIILMIINETKPLGADRERLNTGRLR